MPPKAEDIESGPHGNPIKRMPSNAELIPDAGKVVMDEAKMWGKGIISDFRETVGTHWLAVSLRCLRRYLETVSRLLFGSSFRSL